MNYAESVRYLYSLGNEVLTAKLGLERITALAPSSRQSTPGVPLGTRGWNERQGVNLRDDRSGLARGRGFVPGSTSLPTWSSPPSAFKSSGVPVSQEQFASAF